MRASSQQPAASSQQPAASSQQPAASSQQPADPWATVGTIKSVLFVGRTIQATARLLYDVMPLLSSDTRIQIYFTIDHSTEFGDQVPRLLDREQVKIIPWPLATDRDKFDCDVTVTASANENLSLLPGRKLVMAHGAGHHKYRAEADGAEDSVSGLSPHQLLVNGKVHPSAIQLAGPEQLDRLRDNCPQALSRAVVTGDVCAERLHAGEPHRDRYRRHLGIGRGERLIVITSTWRFDSLLSRWPGLPVKLLGELPASDYRVAFVLHPNSWDRHGRPQVHGWLRTARRAGLIIIPPHEGWRAAVVASDCVIADHGSVGFYAADLGRPLLYATFSQSEVPADSPAAMLSRTAPFLDPNIDMATQVATVIDGHHRDRYREITSLALDPVGSAAARLREVLYRLLELEPIEDAPAAQPFPLPETETDPVTAFHAYPVEDESAVLRIIRFPITDVDAAQRRRYRDRIMVVDAAEPDRQHWYAASVLTWTESQLDMVTAIEWSNTKLAMYPGIDVIVAELLDAKTFVRSRRYDTFVVACNPAPEPSSLGAVIYHRTLCGDLPAAFEYREGERRYAVTLEPFG